MEASKPVDPSKEKRTIDKYEVDNAVRVLLEAEEIKQNAPLMKLVSESMTKKKKAIDSISGLKAASNKLAMGDED